MARYERDWSEWSGLTDPTILPVARQILDHVGLWTDESVRALVLHNLAYRCGVIFAGMEELREYFVAKIPQGITRSLDEAQDLVMRVADNVSEMVTKRPINAVQYDMPKTQMSQADWQRFLRAEVGNNLGLFSTVFYFTEWQSKTPLSSMMQAYRQIKLAALTNYLADPEYRKFAANPDRIIKDAIKMFKTETEKEK